MLFITGDLGSSPLHFLQNGAAFMTIIVVFGRALPVLPAPYTASLLPHSAGSHGSEDKATAPHRGARHLMIKKNSQKQRTLTTLLHLTHTHYITTPNAHTLLSLLTLLHITGGVLRKGGRRLLISHTSFFTYITTHNRWGPPQRGGEGFLSPTLLYLLTLLYLTHTHWSPPLGGVSHTHYITTLNAHALHYYT